jgi:hypothetical protein
MKTKNIIAILATLPILAGFSGCKSDDITDARPENETLIIEEGNTIMMASGDESGRVTITADCRWAVDPVIVPVGDSKEDIAFASNLIVQPMSGTGNGTLVIVSDQNKDVQPREAYITLTSYGGLKQRIKIRQNSGDANMSISERTLDFAAQPAAAQQLIIESNKGWDIQIPAGVDWVHLDKTTGTAGAQTINVTVDRIMSDVARSCKLNVIYGTSSAQVLVRQEGLNSENIVLFTNPYELYIDGKGGEQIIHVESNASWRAFVPSSAESWMHLEHASGAGNGEIRVWCEPNPDSNRERLSVIIIVAGSQNPKQADILVQQGVYGGGDKPEEQWFVDVNDFDLMWLSETEAELRFMFHSNKEVGEYGVVYSTTQQMPTIQNASAMTVGSGGISGEPIVVLEPLEPNTTYYTRAFVTTSQNGGTYYYSPNVVSFTTPEVQKDPNENDNPDPKLAPRR